MPVLGRLVLLIKFAKKEMCLFYDINFSEKKKKLLNKDILSEKYPTRINFLFIYLHSKKEIRDK